MAAKVKRAKKNPISASDPMAEAGRKIFAQQYRQMRRHEDGSRSGEDIESVHRMRVAIRRMRTLFRLIGAHYRPGTVDGYQRGLRRVARALGAVRDLDVLILDLQAFAATLPAEEQIELAAVISLLEKRRADYRVRLNALFDSKQYGRFLRRCERLFKKRGRGARPIKQREFPHQVRHVLPVLLHDRMARVKAYDTVLPAAEDTILHALRVEFKQLRYALEFFQPILGSPAGAFLQQVKAIQEILGRISDIAVFTEYMYGLDNLPSAQNVVIESYINARDEELVHLRQQFNDVWVKFNTRATQRLFSDSLLVLR